MLASLDVKDTPALLDPPARLAKTARRAPAIIARSHEHHPATSPRRPAALAAAVPVPTDRPERPTHGMALAALAVQLAILIRSRSSTII